MKTKFFLLTALIFFSTYLFSQVETVRPLTEKTEVATPATTKAVKSVKVATPVIMKTAAPQAVKSEKVSTPAITKQIIPQPVKSEKVVTSSITKPTMSHPVKTINTPPTATLTGAQIYIVTGETGKTVNTLFSIEIDDSKQLKAADYTEVGLTQPVEDDRVLGHIKYVPFYPQFPPGDNESISAQLESSEVQGVELIGMLPTNVTRYAIFSDFVNGGSISILIHPKIIYPLIGPDTWKINSLTFSFTFDNDPASPHVVTWNGCTLSLSNLSQTLKFDKNFHPIQ